MSPLFAIARVRFLSSLTAAIPRNLLTALDEWNGEPKFHELEPARRVVAADRRASSRRLSLRDGHGILP
jgi:hypothetical protein